MPLTVRPSATCKEDNHGVWATSARFGVTVAGGAAGGARSGATLTATAMGLGAAMDAIDTSAGGAAENPKGTGDRGRQGSLSSSSSFLLVPVFKSGIDGPVSEGFEI